MLHTHSPTTARAGGALPASADAWRMRIGVEDLHGHLASVIEVHGLVEAVQLFESLRALGLQCGAGRRVGALRLQRVFVPLHAMPDADAPALGDDPGAALVCEEV